MQDILISVEQKKQQKTNRDSDLKTLCSEKKKIKVRMETIKKKKKKEQKETLNVLEVFNSVNSCTELCGIKMERAK